MEKTIQDHVQWTSERWLGHFNAALIGVLGSTRDQWSPEAVIAASRILADLAIKVSPAQDPP